MRTHVAWLTALVLPALGLVANGCTGDDPAICSGPECTGTDAGGEGGVGSGFEISSGASITLVQGAVVQVDITVTRSGFDGPITATASGLPGGVAAAPLVVPAGATTAKLTLSALPNAAQGTTPITIAASDSEGKIRRDRPASLLVRGPAGALDTTFGSGGKTTVKVGGTGVSVQGLVVQTDGRVLVAGPSDNDFALARVNVEGTLDSSYGIQGRATADLQSGGVSSMDVPGGVALAPSGNAVVAGYSQSAETAHAVARFLPTGKLDTTFNAVGYATPTFPVAGAANQISTAALVQLDEKPLLAGTVILNQAGTTHYSAVIARFKPGGALDDTFGSGGWFYRQSVVGSTGTDDQCQAIALAPGNKIVGAGNSLEGAGNNVFAVRLNADGGLDSTFGGRAGFATIAFPAPTPPNSPPAVHSVHVLPDGHVLITVESELKIVVVRLDARGAPDATFGNFGKVTLDVGSPVIEPRSILDASGRLVFSAVVKGTEGDIVVARMLATGALDTSFATSGHVTVKVGALVTAGNLRIAQAPDGRIVVATNLNAAAPDVVAFRFWQ